MSSHQKLNNSNIALGRIFAILILIAFFLFIYWVNPQPVREVTHLLSTGNLAGSIEYIRSFGAYAALVSFVIITCINITAIFPNIFMLAATGILFGVVKGTIISWAAESFGVIISFLLMRYFFHDYAHRVIIRSHALQKVDEFSGTNGFKIMLIARTIPFIPSGIITALGAFSSISIKDYVLATFIGKIPSAWIEVTLGHDLASYHEHMARLAVLVLISALSYGFYCWHKNKQK